MSPETSLNLQLALSPDCFTFLAYLVTFLMRHITIFCHIPQSQLEEEKIGMQENLFNKTFSFVLCKHFLLYIHVLVLCDSLFFFYYFALYRIQL